MTADQAERILREALDMADLDAPLNYHALNFLVDELVRKEADLQRNADALFRLAHYVPTHEGETDNIYEDWARPYAHAVLYGGQA